MRARNIKPGFWENESIGKLTHTQRLLFIGLWCLADREGRLEDRSERISHQLFGYDKRSLNLSGDLSALIKAGMIAKYSNKGAFIQVVNFKKHQTPHHQETQSKLPEYQPPQRSPDISGDSERCLPDSLIPDSLNEDSCPRTNQPKKFKKPTPQEVEEYAQSIGFSLSGQKFCDSNEAKGWLVGKTRTPMKDWKATIRTWKANNYKSDAPEQSLNNRLLEERRQCLASKKK